MMSRLSALIFLLAAVPVLAQFPRNDTSCTLRVDVVLSTGGRVTSSLRVQLLQAMTNSPVAVTMTSNSGTAEFEGLHPGGYHVMVSGDGIELGDSGTFVIEDGKVFESQTVTVRNKQDAGGADSSLGLAVAAVDLNVPKEAAKEFQRAGKEMASQNWTKAIDHLNKAIAIYPKYSSAYNNLAVCYNHLNQPERQSEALRKAISVNDHCVPALVNLARILLSQGNFIEAAGLLNKAVTADPVNVEALTLLARADFMQGHYDQVLEEARKVHSMPHQHYAIVHYTAASAFEREGRIQDAVAELQMFLQEEPNGPRADAVRKAVVALQSQH